MIKEVTWGDKSLHRVTSCYRGFQGVKGGHCGLKGVTGGYMGLQEITGGKI